MSEKISRIFDLDEYKPYKNAWESRYKTLELRQSYYDGSVYRRVRKQIARMGMLGPGVEKLYAGIKPLYLPLSRAVDVDAGIIPGDWVLDEMVPENLAEAMAQIFAWSKWNTDGVLYVHYGAEMGVSGLKISDLREQKKVIIKPVDPQRFMLVASNDYDATPGMSIYLETRMDAEDDYEYAEVVTPDEIRTYRNAESYGFGDRDPVTPNELGFVPYVEVRHIETGKSLGECTFQKAIDLLDEVNQLASYLADIIKKHAEPQWAAFGVDPSDLVKSGDKVWFFPGKATDAKPLVAQIDIAGVLAFIQEIAKNVDGALPELAFDELKSKTQIATATLELQLLELVLKIKRCRPNYDDGLTQALRLAGRAGQSMGLPDIAVLDNDVLAFDEKRPVLPLDPVTEMELEQMQINLERERSLVINEGMGL